MFVFFLFICHTCSAYGMWYWLLPLWWSFVHCCWSACLRLVPALACYRLVPSLVDSSLTTGQLTWTTCPTGTYLWQNVRKLKMPKMSNWFRRKETIFKTILVSFLCPQQSPSVPSVSCATPPFIRFSDFRAYFYRNAWKNDPPASY